VLLLGDPDRAADVVQDTWVASLKRPPRHAKSLRGWLAVVARNLARRTEHDGSAREIAVPASITLSIAG
jgi:DNA-directed RNA polymerase specialized sigma24 family protein